jgi:hypothetical protein
VGITVIIIIVIIIIIKSNINKIMTDGNLILAKRLIKKKLYLYN